MRVLAYGESNVGKPSSYRLEIYFRFQVDLEKLLQNSFLPDNQDTRKDLNMNNGFVEK